MPGRPSSIPACRATTVVTVEVFGSKLLGDLKSHGKILLVDGRVAVVGGLAFAAISLDFRREVAIVIEEPEAVAEIGRLFGSLDAEPTQGRPRTGDVESAAVEDRR